MQPALAPHIYSKQEITRHQGRWAQCAHRMRIWSGRSPRSMASASSLLAFLAPRPEMSSCMVGAWVSVSERAGQGVQQHGRGEQAERVQGQAVVLYKPTLTRIAASPSQPNY